jgi:CHAD domain-containing protein
MTYLTRAILDREGAVLLEDQRIEALAMIKSELGDKHPVALMVEMTMKYDETTARIVMEKLEAIKAGLEATITKEVEQEAAKQMTFNTIIGQLTELRAQLATDLHQSEHILQVKSQDLIVA